MNDPFNFIKDVAESNKSDNYKSFQDILEKIYADSETTVGQSEPTEQEEKSTEPVAKPQMEEKRPAVIDDLVEGYDLDPEIEEQKQVVFTFGKNGGGLTTEFIKIGERIADLSKTNHVYLADAKIDVLDDTYTLTFDCYDRN